MSIDEENQRLRAQIAALQQRVGARLDLPPQERDDIARASARADAVAQQFGNVGASLPVPGETAMQFRRRVLAPFAKHSEAYRNADIERISDPALLAAAEDRIYADATAKANDSDSYRAGELHAIKFRDPAGRECTRYVGDSLAWRAHFMTGAQVGRIKSPNEIASDTRA